MNGKWHCNSQSIELVKNYLPTMQDEKSLQQEFTPSLQQRLLASRDIILYIYKYVYIHTIHGVLYVYIIYMYVLKCIRDIYSLI